jgi:hypothetical protein
MQRLILTLIDLPSERGAEALSELRRSFPDFGIQAEFPKLVETDGVRGDVVDFSHLVDKI